MSRWSPGAAPSRTASPWLCPGPCSSDAPWSSPCGCLPRTLEERFQPCRMVSQRDFSNLSALYEQKSTQKLGSHLQPPRLQLISGLAPDMSGRNTITSLQSLSDCGTWVRLYHPCLVRGAGLSSSLQRLTPQPSGFFQATFFLIHYTHFHFSWKSNTPHWLRN